MASNKKAKGNSFERAVANWLAKNYGYNARRHIPFTNNARRGDIFGTPYHIEVKNYKDEVRGLKTGIDQARREADGDDWVVVAKHNGNSLVKMSYMATPRLLFDGFGAICVPTIREALAVWLNGGNGGDDKHCQCVSIDNENCYLSYLSYWDLLPKVAAAEKLTSPELA